MYTATSITVYAAVLLLVLLSTTTSTTTPIPGLDTFLSQQSRLDPHSTNDTLLSLPSSLKKLLSLPSPSIPNSISSLLSLSLPLSVHVRLVGSSFSFSSTNLLSSFLSSAVSSDHFHLISPSPSHRLATKHAPYFDISLSSPSLSSRLFHAINSSLSSSASSLRSSLVSVGYDTVDSIIQTEFDKEKSNQGVFIYLISVGSQGRNYAYSYSLGDSSPGFSKCFGTIWTGKDRYLWIDLSAGPVDYGPALSGDGLLPRGEFHPLATMHGGPKSEKATLANLGSLVLSAYQVFLVPSLQIPVYYESSLIIEFVHVYGSNSGKDKSGLDLMSIERTFMDEVKERGLLLGDQSLRFRNYEVNYGKCGICSFAITRSTNSYTSRFLFDNYTLIVSEYLDSKRLHQILSDSAEEFRRVAGIPGEEFGRVLPVYVFDLDYNGVLLLDRYHQSVAFRDMVVAVRTRTTQTVSDYSCNGRHVFINSRELERPIVGSVLQSMWGVSPTHLSWSSRHNSTLVDYTWSVGQTPFGPFSESSSLSFVQKDAARRNVLLTSLNYSITSAVDVLDSIQAHGGDRKLLKQNHHVEFVQRLNLFKYKIDKAITAMSHLGFEMALYYLKSSDHDLYAIHSLVYHATQELEAALVCFKDPPFPWGSFLFAAVGMFALFFVYAKRDKLFRNKRKQF